jgi:hypothetical protein
VRRHEGHAQHRQPTAQATLGLPPPPGPHPSPPQPHRPGPGDAAGLGAPSAPRHGCAAAAQRHLLRRPGRQPRRADAAGRQGQRRHRRWPAVAPGHAHVPPQRRAAPAGGAAQPGQAKPLRLLCANEACTTAALPAPAPAPPDTPAPRPAATAAPPAARAGQLPRPQRAGPADRAAAGPCALCHRLYRCWCAARRGPAAMCCLLCWGGLLGRPGRRASTGPLPLSLSDRTPCHCAGVAGTLASYLLTPAPSMGASAAVFGAGAALALYYHRHRHLHGASSQRMLQSLGLTVALNAAFTLVSKRIDNWWVGGWVPVGGVALPSLAGRLSCCLALCAAARMGHRWRCDLLCCPQPPGPLVRLWCWSSWGWDRQAPPVYRTFAAAVCLPASVRPAACARQCTAPLLSEVPPPAGPCPAGATWAACWEALHWPTCWGPACCRAAMDGCGTCRRCQSWRTSRWASASQPRWRALAGPLRRAAGACLAAAAEELPAAPAPAALLEGLAAAAPLLIFGGCRQTSRRNGWSGGRGRMRCCRGSSRGVAQQQLDEGHVPQGQSATSAACLAQTDR